MNWKVRFKNKLFWLTMIPLVFLLIQQIAGIFGITLEFSGLVDQLKGIVETVFLILAGLGIVVDMTTDGVLDSSQAMTYTEPKKSE